MLQEAKVQFSEPRERTTFDTKLVGYKVCNNCYADAIGYLQQQFKYLKWSILTPYRSSGLHGNSDCNRKLTYVAACRFVMEAIFHECECPQPHKHAKRLSSKEWKEVRLLPMNTKREDILAMVNKQIATMGAILKVSKARFNRMWAEEFTEVRIPWFAILQMPNMLGIERMFGRNAGQVAKAKNLRELRAAYIDSDWRTITLLGCEAYSNREARRHIVYDCKHGPKRNHGAEVPATCKRDWKTLREDHLCGILVYGLALYCHMWLDALHKHNSNQVVMSIIRVLGNVRSRRGTLPPTLCIQADNCSRENKNKYMFGFCATLVALGHFWEVQLSFLIVGHTHEDINQRFNIVLRALERHDILSMKQCWLS